MIQQEIKSRWAKSSNSGVMFTKIIWKDQATLQEPIRWGGK
jgi:hypothetical protein